MKRVKLDSAENAVKEFVRSLPVDAEGIELELEGKVVCEVVAPRVMSTFDRSGLIARVRERAKVSREKNAGVPADVIQREIQDAVDEVRRRKNS